MKLLAFFSIITALSLHSCGGGEAKTEEKKEAPAATPAPKSQADIDREKIEQYLSAKSMEAQQTASGIFYIIEKEGEGSPPTVNNKVTVHYKGTLLDGSVFDSSYDRGEPITFPLNGVIKGWQEGIPLLKKGGKGTLIIPSGLAYGPRQMGPKIGPNSVLIFEVELLEIN